MKDNDVFHCSFLRSLKDAVKSEDGALCIEEIISHLYDLAKIFQV